ncbi:MAG TPA: hypothetical protein VFL14_11720 [Xanthomonadales bacterium]|nr:hypothetical protein [Xanthomonadales bacterium]
MNTWLHSIVVVLAASPAVTALHAAAWRYGSFESTLILAKLLPGLVLGWFTRRHPLVVGAAAGVAGLLACDLLDAIPHARGPVDEIVSAGLATAVAALAGRALRFRFSPRAPNAS